MWKIRKQALFLDECDNEEALLWVPMTFYDIL